MDKKTHENSNTNELLDEAVVDDLQTVELKEKIKTLEDKNLRMQADFQNIKKRLEDEKHKSITFANEKFAFDLLEVLDILYIAEQSISNAKEREGIYNTINKFEQLFRKYQITEISYDEFDPYIHEAVNKEYSETVDKGSITNIHRKGYIINDKILRPGMVSISNGASE